MVEISLVNFASPGRRKKRLSWSSFLELNDKETWQVFFDSPELEINLDGIHWLDPDGLIWVYFILLYRHSRGLATQIGLPETEEGVAYIRYLGLDQLQETYNFSFWNHDLLDFSSLRFTPRDEDLVALHKIFPIFGSNWDGVIARSHYHVKNYVQRQYQNSAISDVIKNYIDPFTFTLRELIHNVALHGGDQIGDGAGFVSFVPPAKGKDKIRYAFSDIGHGFSKTLRDKLDPKRIQTDYSAILEGLIFRRSHKESGVEGLYPTLRFLRAAQGVIGIRSGKSFVVIDFSEQNTCSIFDSSYDVAGVAEHTGWLKKIAKSINVIELPGTHVFVDLTIKGGE